jgi:long-chain acyl-CoA synthetase
MYTSGTTGDPKGVLISNKSIITIVSAVDEFLSSSGEEVGYLSIVFYFSLLYPNALSLPFTNLILIQQLRDDDVYISYLPLAHIFDRLIEEVFIHHGASIGFWRGVRIGNTCFCAHYLSHVNI